MNSASESASVFLQQLNASLVSAGNANGGVQNLVKKAVQVVLLDKAHTDLMEEGHVMKIGLELPLCLAQLGLRSFSSGDVAIRFQNQHAVALVRHQLVARCNEDLVACFRNVSELALPKAVFAQFGGWRVLRRLRVTLPRASKASNP